MWKPRPLPYKGELSNNAILKDKFSTCKFDLILGFSGNNLKGSDSSLAWLLAIGECIFLNYSCSFLKQLKQWLITYKYLEIQNFPKNVIKS